MSNGALPLSKQGKTPCDRGGLLTLDFSRLSVLVTGGTGTFGQAFVKLLLRHDPPARLIVLSRDEFKQFEMRKSLNPGPGSPLRFFIGDVRDREIGRAHV